MDLWAADRLEEMKARLVRIGASDAEIEDFAEEWVNDDEWEREDKQRLYALGDVKLREDLMATRAELLVATTPDDELAKIREFVDDDEAEAARIAALDEEAQTIATGKVAEVLAWVGTDADDEAVIERAQASLAHESAMHSPRKTLVVALQELIAAAPLDPDAGLDNPEHV